MATSSHDLLRIYHRYSLLGFFLALCNPSTILTSLSSLQHPNFIQHAGDMLHNMRWNRQYIMVDRFFSIGLLGFKNKLRMSNITHDLILHLATTSIVAVMIWQAVFLSICDVIVFAYLAWHKLFTWVWIGSLINLLSAIAWRLYLGPTNPSMRWLRFHWSLSHSRRILMLAHPYMARFSELLFKMTGLMNYGYGTVILSETTSVSPPNALIVFCLMEFWSMSSRLLDIWLLEVFLEVAVAER